MSIGKKLTGASICLGAISFLLPFWISSHYLEWRIAASFCVPIFWAGVLVSSVVRFGKSGLWFLAGAPLALWWPFLWFMLPWSAVW